MKFYSYQSVKNKLFKDKKVKEAYDALGPEYQVIEMIIRKRIQEQLTWAELAKKAGIKRSVLLQLVQGTYNPSFRFLQKVARAMDAELKVTIV